MLFPFRFELTTPAVDDRPVFVTGNFCEWATGLDATQLQPTGPGTYAVDVLLDESLPDGLDYKYYRGGEGSLELDDEGELTPNRTANRADGLEKDYVPFWQWNGLPINPAHLPIEQVLYIDEPDQPEPRRVQVALPYDYVTSDQAYPVLYMTDGQNIVGEGSGYGSWKAEFRMAQLASRGQQGVIIVAVDHADEARMGEYTVEARKAGLGKGDAHINFLVNTVKAHIDANYRTLPDAAHTGIGGSSLGGLLAVWAGLRRPDVFGRWLVFSPALWISPGVYAAARQQPLPADTKIYLYGGEAESRNMVPTLHRLQNSLQCATEDECAYLQIAVDPAGKHEEWRWSREFGKAVAWLFFNVQ
ncbi:carbohydrate esterase [Fibrella sp. HMF5335]|uniref:Carbohydrate esterase n=1 Tax=Fibrella rubiginis TaxID=2817060 RepID=A0A939GBD4_9BACT|nr:alpha/beta hydrolase-fold protein [Fibrella rubiginis]MBO0935922.1 carbohydrate esterase [Fibrella rubiginis]